MTEHPAMPLQGAPIEREPHSIEAEQALLGAILNQNEALARLGRFDGAWLHDPIHRQIYQTALSLIEAGQRANPVTLSPYFEQAPPIDEHLTVPQYLGRLAAAAAGSLEAPSYARMIRDLHTARELIKLAADIHTSALCPPRDLPPEKQIAEIEARLDQLRERAESHKRTTTGYEAIQQSIDAGNDAYQRGGGLVGVATGLRSLDDMLGGLVPSELIILGGATSMGKSALGLSIALSAARDQNVGVAFYTLEMSAKQFGGRILAIETGVSPSAIRRGAFTERDMTKMMGCWAQYRDKPLYINDSSGITISQLAADARRLRRVRPFGLLVVDYLQLLQGSTYRGVNRTNEIAEISQGLKSLAKELNVPVLALAQLSRKTEERESKRPGLADLREGGSIEHDADVVMFVHREEYWIAKERPAPTDLAKVADWKQRLADSAGKAEVIIAKFRDGPLGTVELGFDGPRTLFMDRGQS